jgi:hypothetical protein
VVHPVDEIDVGDPPGLEHRRVPPGATGKSVTRAVLRTVVGLDLDQASAEHGAVLEATAQNAAQEVACDLEGVAPIE